MTDLAWEDIANANAKGKSKGVDAEGGREEGDDEPQDGEVGNVTLGDGGVGREVEVPRDLDGLGDPELGEAVYVVRERGPLEGEGAGGEGDE